MILDNSGFNVLQEIANKTGESMSALSKRMRDGKIMADEVTQAFIRATDKGGTFANGMEALSKTLDGKLSTLSDSFSNLGIAIGGAFSPGLKGLTDKLTNFIKYTIPEPTNFLSVKGFESLTKSAFKSGIESEEGIYNFVAKNIKAKQLVNPHLMLPQETTDIILGNHRLYKGDKEKLKYGGITKEDYIENTNTLLSLGLKKATEEQKQKFKVGVLQHKFGDVTGDVLSKLKEAEEAKAKEAKLAKLAKEKDEAKAEALKFAKELDLKFWINEAKKRTEPKTGKKIETIGSAISTGGRRVQEVTINVKEMNGLNAPNLTDIKYGTLVDGVRELPALLRQLLGTLQLQTV